MFGAAPGRLVTVLVSCFACTLFAGGCASHVGRESDGPNGMSLSTDERDRPVGSVWDQEIESPVAQWEKVYSLGL